MEDNLTIEKRREKIKNIFIKKEAWIICVLIITLILGVYIRTLPMQTNPVTGNPGLWDIIKNAWTLGPDLDPWLFIRIAGTIVENGSIPKIDIMRNVPLGFDNSKETQLLPYMIAGTYWFLKAMPFVDAPNIEFAGIIFPVIMFALTIIAFFLFVREIFVRSSKESKTKANIVSSISTFFMIVIPVFIPRTIAGIPEKESAAFFFMFLSLYLFLKAWKSRNPWVYITLGVLAGISTAIMGLVWGGVLYLFITIGASNLIAFILNKIHKKEFIIYSSWVISSFSILILSSNKFSIGEMLTSLSSGLPFGVFLIFIVHFVLWNTKLANSSYLKKIKLPENIISIIVTIVLGLILSSILMGPSFILEKLKAIHQTIFKPIMGRWNITVAENRQPFFTEWASNFGPFIGKIPILFSLFFIGSIVLFKNMLKHIKNKEAWILSALYTFFLIGIIFSRYSPASILNGENAISKFLYYLSVLMLLGIFVYYYTQYSKKGNKGFEKISYEYLLLFVLFSLCLFTARGAVRLIMVLAPIAPIFAGYLIVDSFYKFRDSKDETKKFFIGLALIILIICSIFGFYSFYKTAKIQSSQQVPGIYNQQWQKAMKWVRDETPQNAVFAHWWDYGYWVQSIGERATVLDGGNAITYWNYLMGRHVLTGDNQKDALEFLYNHNATHLLIDSTDIGKYGAFSSIGSDETYDRYSFIPVMISSQEQIQETREGIIRIYEGGSMTDEDIVYNKEGKEIFLPSGKSMLGAVILRINQTDDSLQFKQPTGLFLYNNVQYELPIRYLYYQGEFIDFESGIESTARITQKINSAGGGSSIDNEGAMVYISQRVMRGFLAQKYLLNDPFSKFSNFQIAHIESNFFVNNLRLQGVDIEEFVYYQGLQGPIKIWSIKYTGDEQIKEEYLDTDASKYLSWEL